MIVKYTEKELDLLARLMRAEALGEGNLGMLMVGNVGVNRVMTINPNIVGGRGYFKKADIKSVSDYKAVVYKVVLAANAIVSSTTLVRGATLALEYSADDLLNSLKAS